MLLGWNPIKMRWNWLKNDCSEGFGICSESTDLLLENVQDGKSEKLGWPLCPTRHNTISKHFKFMLKTVPVFCPITTLTWSVSD
jgi:hypothetical protein